jgi:myo-inositol-1(or 4)-monophosphatase
MRELLKETLRITREAGDVVMSFYQDSFSVAEKSPDNPVTDADLVADALLKDRLMSLKPEAGWLSEETVDDPVRLEKSLCWVVDPLDGTKEFVLGVPEFTISVALVEGDDPVLAVIYNPASGEFFHALRGQGRNYDGSISRVSERSSLLGARVDASRSERMRGEFKSFETDMDIRTMGSIAYKLARVSAGIADATWSRGPKNEWDICAGVLLIQEAGGTCVDLDNAPIRFNRAFPKVNGIIADNAHLHDQIITVLAPYRSTARVD